MDKFTGGRATTGLDGNRGSQPTAKLGKNGPQVTRIGYGAMGLSAFYGKPKPDEERFAVLDKVFADGCHFWDSSDVYADSETLLSNWFKRNPGAREKIFLATKFAFRFEDGQMSLDSSPEYLKQACEKSLRTLGVDHIDLYYAHRLDQKTPIEKTMQGLNELKQQGKIRYIGLSECSSDSLRRASKVAHVDAVQIEYSPFSLDIESDQIGLLKTARELGTAIVAYSPLGRGMLGGKVRSPDDFEEGDSRRNLPRFSKANFDNNLKLVDTINSIASRKKVTPSQLTLSWLLAQGDDIFPIPGSTNIARVEENLAAAGIALTREEEQEIRKACESAIVHGGRYGEDFSFASFADTPALDSTT